MFEPNKAKLVAQVAGSVYSSVPRDALLTDQNEMVKKAVELALQIVNEAKSKWRKK